MPVASMSIRALIGMVQAFDTPGNCSALSSSATSFSMVMPGRHSLAGFRLITVSNISVGARSVAVVARPALPHTNETSGTVSYTHLRAHETVLDLVCRLLLE